MLTPLLRELHRLRKLVRDAQSEIERGPRVLKIQQTKLANHEKALADAREDLKKRKAAILTAEAQIKSLNQTLARYQKQLDTLTTPRDIDAKQLEIKNTTALVAQQEDELLTSMTEVDERSPKIPELEAALVKAKADFAIWEKEAAERMVRLKEELKVASALLVEEEKKIPPAIRGAYDRIVKAHGADGLASVENNSSCHHCRITITAQHLHELRSGDFVCCRNCGRILYIPE